MADDTKPNEAGLALLNAQMDSLARESRSIQSRGSEARGPSQRDFSPDRIGGGVEVGSLLCCTLLRGLGLDPNFHHLSLRANGLAFHF
jgi:hypothetical protein